MSPDICSVAGGVKTGKMNAAVLNANLVFEKTASTQFSHDWLCRFFQLTDIGNLMKRNLWKLGSIIL